MAYIDPRYLEHQRKRFMRHDAHRYIRHDAYRFAPPGSPRYSGKDVVRYFEPETGTERSSLSVERTENPTTMPADLHRENDHVAFRHEVSKLRLDFELLRFALRGQKGGFNPDQPRDDRGRWTDGGGAPEFSAQRRMGGIRRKFWDLTVREFVARNCEGKINRELPGQFEDVTLGDIIELAKGGDAAAKKCYKLLNEPRFRKK